MSGRPAVVPARLRRGDTVRVVAPSLSRAVVSEHDNGRWIAERLTSLGLAVTFGDHVDERDLFASSSVESRVADLHAAFADPRVAGILTVIGGFNAGELLPHLDWELIRAHPKVFCGYSDITALSNAILARAGLVTYSGPHWSTFGMRDHFEPAGRWFEAAVFGDGPIQIEAADYWTDDPWYADQDAREPVASDGWWTLGEGSATGRIVGGNLCTLNLLQGTDFMPSLGGAALFVEDDALTDPQTFARDLTSLLQLPDADGVEALLIGRFQRRSDVRREHLAEIVARQPALTGKPVVANLDFGHTHPLFTYPIGGQAQIEAARGRSRIVVAQLKG